MLFALGAQSSAANAEPLHDSLLAAVNAYRASRGLATVVASPTLQAAAQFMADDVAQHVSEIIAWGAPNVDRAMRLWLNSPPHWAELNDGRYRAAGLGVACGGTFPCVWVVTFGSLVDQTYSAPAYHATFYAESPFPTVARNGRDARINRTFS